MFWINLLYKQIILYNIHVNTMNLFKLVLLKTIIILQHFSVGKISKKQLNTLIFKSFELWPMCDLTKQYIFEKTPANYILDMNAVEPGGTVTP